MTTSSGGGFGPVGPAAGGAPPFAVSGPSQLTLDAARTAIGSFVVSNITGRPVKSRVFVTPGAGADAAWFQIVGESERALPVAGNATVDVKITASDKVPAGAHSFVLNAALEDDPNQVVAGPTVAFAVPEGKPPRFPWWIVIVAVAALLLVVGGGLAIWWFTRGEPQPSPSPTPTGDPAVLITDTAFVFPNSYFDLDENLAFAGPAEGVDVFFYPGGGSLEMGVVGQGPPRLSVVDEPTFAACESATDYDDINAQNIDLLPDRATHVCVRVTDQSHMAVMSVGPLTGNGYILRFTTWERG